jgi:hypothetical protein
MEWEFTPEDVVKARAGYSLADFRHGLAEEVRINLGVDDDAQQLRTFNLIYDMCYALATNKDLDAFLAAYAYDPPTVQFLRELQPLMVDNVVMLGAILQRLIMDRVEAGVPLEQAVQNVALWHADTVREPPTAPAGRSGRPDVR